MTQFVWFKKDWDALHNWAGICSTSDLIVILWLCCFGIITSRLLVLSVHNSFGIVCCCIKFIKVSISSCLRALKASPISALRDEVTFSARNNSSITLYPIIVASRHSFVTRNGTESLLSGDNRRNSSSTHPWYGILLPLAAVSSNVRSNSSQMFLILAEGATLSSTFLEMMETWAPVSQRMLTPWPLR